MNEHSEAIIALYERNAYRFDEDRDRSLIERHWLDRFIALLPERAHILDIGCGHGEPIAQYFIENNFQLTGVDSSDTLISMCRERFPDHTWLVEDMRELALGQTYQGLIAWDSFFHLSRDDQRRMFPRFKAHAEPGAALLFTSGISDGEIIGCYCDEPLYHASLGQSEFTSLLEVNGFTTREHVVEDPNCGLHTVWLAQRVY